MCVFFLQERKLKGIESFGGLFFDFYLFEIIVPLFYHSHAVKNP
jgi:hypothetical protein